MGNKTQSWAMISDLLKQQTDCDLLKPQQIVTRWLMAEPDELIDEAMGSATKAERDAFKAAVEQLTDRWELVLMWNDIETRRRNIAEKLEVARLYSFSIFQY